MGRHGRPPPLAGVTPGGLDGLRFPTRRVQKKLFPKRRYSQAVVPMGADTRHDLVPARGPVQVGVPGAIAVMPSLR